MSPENERGRLSRREFVRTGAGAALVSGAGATASQQESQARIRLPAPDLGPAPAGLLAAPPIETVRIGFVGVGGMGTVHVRNLVDIPGTRIVAVCDIREAHARRASDIISAKGNAAPRLYTRGERDFERMCAEEELDLVYNATPWEWHVPIALAAMANGKHTASEVPFAMTVEDCWKLVESAETHRRHCVMMENCNYDRPEMMAFHMVRRGALGEVLHGECGYLHDLRAIKFADEGEGLWRRAWSMTHDANLYPTHGLGPIANCMDINRGDRFDYLVSMSSPSRGLQVYAAAHYPEGHAMRGEAYRLGDVNTTLIRTALGRTIFLSHDTNLPRPYSRIHMVQGTRGIVQGYPHRVYVEGRSTEHGWDTADQWYDEFDHPMWQAIRDRADEFGGHGGMDFLEDYRLIRCLREGLPTDMNVYDAAALSAVVELTGLSVASGSRPVEFPDFTRGRWRTWPRLGVLEL
ncbi:MAG: Gfo/Idh/MocA family oxidoreductase [Gemmatimonadetes bacterium]|nr:Gfo/Idh/MocA family oxidoreductase [Gemmatimonadota bacterium]